MKARVHIAVVAVLGLLPTACAHTNGQTTSQPGATAEQNREIYLSLVSAIVDGGKPQAALAFLDEYQARYPDDERSLLLKGDAYFKSGQLDAAGETYRHLLTKTDSPAAEFGLGRVKAAQGDWPDAVSHLRLAYQHSPADPKILNDYGYALLETADAEQAYQLLGRAYELRPKDRIIRNNFVLAAYQTGATNRVDEIVHTLDRADQAKLKAFLARWSAHSSEPETGTDHPLETDKGR